jgi:hypothetical protein
MTRVMFDSVTPDAIPLTGARLVAGYATGPFANLTALHARFPRLPVVSIDTDGSDPAADVRDWETGDKSGSLQDWVIAHNRAATRKTAVVYCNRSTIGEVRLVTGTQVLGVDYWLWIATLDGSVFGPAAYPGVIACQDLGATQTGGNYDSSVVFADWWKTSPIVTPGPPPRNKLVTELESSVTGIEDVIAKIEGKP